MLNKDVVFPNVCKAVKDPTESGRKSFNAIDGLKSLILIEDLLENDLVLDVGVDFRTRLPLFQEIQRLRRVVQ
jgi:hypothetical protein